MNIAEIFGELDGLGSTGDKRIMSISSDDERLVLPVTPWKYQAQLSQNNKIVDILDFGEMVVFGNTKLHRLKFSCFFPDTSHEYRFVVGDIRTPQECLEMLNRWKTSQEPVRVILTDSPVNEVFAIMDINFREKDGTRDIEYDIDLVEYRDWNVPESNYTKTVNSLTGLKDRAGVRSTAALSTFLDKNTRDFIEAVTAITGSPSNLGSVFSTVGSLTGNASMGQIGSIIQGTQQLSALGLSDPYALGATLVLQNNSMEDIMNVIQPKGIRNPISTIKSASKVLTNTVKGVAGTVKNVVKSIFKW